MTTWILPRQIKWRISSPRFNPGSSIPTWAKAGVDLDYALGAVFYSEKSNLNYISHDASLYAKYLTASHINFYLKESFIRSDNP